ncbi:MAG: phosphohistidine phosphatase SixA [Verrucomicrobiota bacterium JB022]|nr:phosphohistidine phosphatase SixA [Verrucomicrobiota bacterium JB022]
MILYLLRHAEAVDLAPDPQRQLTHKGREDSLALGQYLQCQHLLDVGAIWHSPYVRARETAELLVHAHGGGLPKLQAIDGITPEDDPRALEAKLQMVTSPTLIVSHNPFLSLLAAWLLTGSFSAFSVRFKKAGLMCLEVHAGPGQPLRGSASFRWMITPAHYRSDF